MRLIAGIEMIVLILFFSFDIFGQKQVNWQSCPHEEVIHSLETASDLFKQNPCYSVNLVISTKTSIGNGQLLENEQYAFLRKNGNSFMRSSEFMVIVSGNVRVMIDSVHQEVFISDLEMSSGESELEKLTSMISGEIHAANSCRVREHSYNQKTYECLYDSSNSSLNKLILEFNNESFLSKVILDMNDQQNAYASAGQPINVVLSYSGYQFDCNKLADVKLLESVIKVVHDKFQLTEQYSEYKLVDLRLISSHQ